jgi:PAS domain-containing protein
MVESRTLEARTLLDGLDVGLAAIAPDWTIAEWSAPAARLTGLPVERVVGQNFWTAFPTAKGTHVERVLQDTLADGQPRQYVWPARAPEHSGMVFETRVTRGPRNHLILLFHQVREEIPAETRAGQILTAFETERRLYYQLFNALPTPAAITTVDGQILEAHPAAVALLGLPDPPSARGRRRRVNASRSTARSVTRSDGLSGCTSVSSSRASRTARWTPLSTTWTHSSAAESCSSSPKTSRRSCCSSGSSSSQTGWPS